MTPDLNHTLRGLCLPTLILVSSAAAQTLSPVSGTTITLPTAPQHTLFIPDGYQPSPDGVDVLVHFHGAPSTLNANAGYAGLNAVIVNVTYSGFSSAYSTPFSNQALFGNIMDAARDSLADQPGFDDDVAWDQIGISSFSAGYGAVREILKNPTYFNEIDGIFLGDSLYASFTSSTDHTPLQSQMVNFKAYAQAAANGSKTMIVSHSQVLTHTYANTAETADALMAHVGITPTAIDQDGLGTLHLYRHAEKGNFSVWGATGNDADAHMEHLRYAAQWLGELPFDVDPVEPGDFSITLADFETSEDPFDYPPTYSGSNTGIAAATADRLANRVGHESTAAQRITVTKDENANEWFLRHTANGGFPAQNTPIPATGWISFWLKTSTPGLSVQIGLDDPDSADLSTLTPVNADGQWHLYQWKLDDPDQWEAWATGDGTITGPGTTIDAIFFHGNTDAIIFLDDVIFSTSFTAYGTPGDANLDGAVNLLDLSALASTFNKPGTWSQGDFNGDGTVDLLDLSLLAANFGSASRPTPEPTTGALLALLLTTPRFRL